MKNHDDNDYLTRDALPGKETGTTKLYVKYNVTAVFSGHDHI